MTKWKYQIPGTLLKAFLEKAEGTKSKENLHLECLALLVGYKENGILTGTDIIFPVQLGTPTLVVDKGKPFLSSFTIDCLRKETLIKETRLKIMGSSLTKQWKMDIFTQCSCLWAFYRDINVP